MKRGHFYLFLAMSTFASISSAAPIISSVGGSDAASIQATVDAFRAQVGDPNNANAPGPVAGGRREINWDGGGDAAPATQFPSPMETFNTAPVTRGGEFVTAGTGFEISGQPAPEFGDLNASYPGLFGVLGTNVLDVLFFVPGTDTAASVNGFGAVFTDVDIAGATTMQFFDDDGTLLFEGEVETGTTDNESLSFLGVSFTEGAVVSRVRIAAGTTGLGPDESAEVDIVAMDDFIYGEPEEIVQAVPEPATALLLIAGLAAFAAARKHALR